METEEKKKQLFEALGELCAMVSITENLIRSIVHSIISHTNTKISECVTSDMHFIPLTQLTVKLYDRKFKNLKDKERLKKLMKRARTLYGKRDEFIHSEWIVWSHDRVEKIKRFETKIANVEDINILIEEFKDINKRLIVFRYDLEPFNKKSLSIIESLLTGKPLP